MNLHELLRQVLALLSVILPVSLSLSAAGVQDSLSTPVWTREDSTSPVVVMAASEVRGKATWYDDGPGYYAAVPSFSWGDKPYRVIVYYKDRSVTVTVRDHCGCYVGNADERVIDLSPAAFAELAPLSVGKITVRYVRGGNIKLPETDTE